MYQVSTSLNILFLISKVIKGECWTYQIDSNSIETKISMNTNG